ncbi:hypothetical protein QR685DRAFT_431159, partial [Neurospora intermedia]
EEAIRLIILNISIVYTNLAGADIVCHWPDGPHTGDLSGHTVDLSGSVEKGATAAKSGLLQDDFHFCPLLGNSASDLGQRHIVVFRVPKGTEILWSLREPANKERRILGFR